MATNKTSPLSVETIKHEDAKRKNIPTAEYQSVMKKEQQSPVRVAYPREREGRNRDLDPQLVWRGKDEQDWSDLVVHAPPLYIQEKVHPKVLIDDLKRRTERAQGSDSPQVDMFADFNGLPNEDAKTEFYAHDAHWANRMILGDSLAVMASLAEREGLRGKVQCIYLDPPYGIKFNSNFQWSTTSRDVKDGNAEHITREPEQVKAFRDTWRDGIHSYLTYLRDRLTVARDLLDESGSIFVQIGDENVHRVRALLDEVFGDENFISQINFQSMTPLESGKIESVFDHIVWYAKDKERIKYKNLYREKMFDGNPEFKFRAKDVGYEELNLSAAPVGSTAGVFKRSVLESSGFTPSCTFTHEHKGQPFFPRGKKSWRTNTQGMNRLEKADRLFVLGSKLYYKLYYDDFPCMSYLNTWPDTVAGFGETKTYVVQTHPKIIQRCMLMTTDPGDLVLDPTCGSGTTATVAEQWGRRWVTIDTSRVALALARARIMGARYPYYLLTDSQDGQIKEAQLTGKTLGNVTTRGSVRQGFVYNRVPRITLGSVAHNSEIDVIWDKYQLRLEPLLAGINSALGTSWHEWSIPRLPDSKWPAAVQRDHAEWWKLRVIRQEEIDASIAAKAEFEYLYDKPYEDKKKVRVAGPFTVESLSPHRVLAIDENDELIDPADPKVAKQQADFEAARDFVQIILDNLKTAGVQQAHKEDRVVFNSLVPWPGDLVCAEGGYEDSAGEKRAAIFIGPEFGTVSRPDLVAAAREAGDAGFDVLIACAFNYDAHSSEFEKLGRIPVLKARMNADLHMAEDLKNTGKGNLFVIFGEPDIDILPAEGGQVRVKVNGVDVFHPNTGEVRSDGAEGIACWFIDTDYNEESFFVRHAYFLGANDPYKALKTTLKAEINEDAWATLNSDTSRAFDKPKSGRIAVKVINHLGDEVMKVFKVS
ncbi:site-specific DNA-methyltransferase [Cupriavidus pauculus]|uniref:site-specific DNA-methyltransferase (adenine-specific) n=1 Tax=Cupriavidus pauculus TaxID=82633 RepID=A0A5P2H4W0_9BURK|nr:site-specific DNA-methyltransferase [Cupriavidus pauculus]QET02553.1 site-specific DNA-methyltransferase [Cupriavidus pauculus]